MMMMANDKTSAGTTAATNDDIDTHRRLSEARRVHDAFDEFMGQLSCVIMRGIELERAFEEPRASVAEAMYALHMAWSVLNADLALLRQVTSYRPGIEIVTQPAMRLGYEVVHKAFPRCLLYVAHQGAGKPELLSALYHLAERVAEGAAYRHVGLAAEGAGGPRSATRWTPMSVTSVRDRVPRCGERSASRRGPRRHVARGTRDGQEAS